MAKQAEGTEDLFSLTEAELEEAEKRSAEDERDVKDEEGATSGDQGDDEPASKPEDQEDSDKQKAQQDESEQDDGGDADTDPNKEDTRTEEEKNAQKARDEERSRRKTAEREASELKGQVNTLQQQLTQLIKGNDADTTDEEKDKQKDAKKALDELKEIASDEDKDALLDDLPGAFNRVIQAVKEVAEGSRGSADPATNIELLGQMSEMVARGRHDDYDAVVYDSGFTEELYSRAKQELEAGTPGKAVQILREINDSKDKGKTLYEKGKMYAEALQKHVAPIKRDEALTNLLKDGTITQEQYDAFKAAAPKPAENEGGGDGDDNEESRGPSQNLGNAKGTGTPGGKKEDIEPKSEDKLFGGFA